MSDGAEVSRTLALAWGLAAAPQRGPKRELSLERIVEAAIAIADAEGLAAVTMQRVAQTFEFSTMALYRYVTTKDELHRLMLDTALGATPSAGPGVTRSVRVRVRVPVPTPWTGAPGARTWQASSASWSRDTGGIRGRWISRWSRIST